MKKITLAVFFLCLFVKNDLQSKEVSSAITYVSGGRLGDRLFCYCKAKWIAYKYGLPLYYQRFEYSNKLVLSLVDKLYETSNTSHLKQKRLRGNVKVDELDPKYFKYIDLAFDDNNTLYIIDQYFFPKMWKHYLFDVSSVIQPYDIVYNGDYLEKGRNRCQFRHDEMIKAFKQDVAFISELKKVIKPLDELKTVSRPKQIISVAVHVRIGGGFDGPTLSPFFYESHPRLNHYTEFISGKDNSAYYKIQRQRRNALVTKISISTDVNIQEAFDILRPLKHVPMQFYVDQIKGLSAMLKDAPLFVYIFTDQPNPTEIKQKFRELIGNKNIVFACREEGNHYNSNVLEDLFSMSEFDCLIRPYSSLSQVAEVLGNHKIVISPYHSIWYQGNLIVDEVLVTINDRNFIKKLYSNTVNSF